jgi:hypothetical protein
MDDINNYESNSSEGYDSDEVSDDSPAKKAPIQTVRVVGGITSRKEVVHVVDVVDTVTNAHQYSMEGLDDDEDAGEAKAEGPPIDTTLESYEALVDTAATGNDLLDIIWLLKPTNLKSGHSITMNNIIKMIFRHSFAHDCRNLYMLKSVNSKCREQIKYFTYLSLSRELQNQLTTLMRMMTPYHGPWGGCNYDVA